jgi:hypothetical protein
LVKWHQEAQIVASRKEAGEPAVSVYGSDLQPGQNATIIGVARQESAKKTEKQGFYRKMACCRVKD